MKLITTEITITGNGIKRLLALAEPVVTATTNKIQASKPPAINQ